MAKWITSDLHFFHDNILKFESMRKHRSDRFDSINDMHEGIISDWNSKVSPKDEIIVVGDFCFGYREKLRCRLHGLIPRLNGKIILVRGNHDPHHGDSAWETYGHKVVDYLEITVADKQKVCISHYPLAVWNKSHYGSIMMHGHSHGSYHAEGRIVDVGWDVWGKVMLIQDLVDIVNQRPIVSKDNH